MSKEWKETMTVMNKAKKKNNRQQSPKSIRDQNSYGQRETPPYLFACPSHSCYDRKHMQAEGRYPRLFPHQTPPCAALQIPWPLVLWLASA